MMALLGVGGVLLLAGCSKKNTNNNRSTSAFSESVIEGHYTAKFKPLNTSITGNVAGKAKIQAMENHFSVAIEMRDIPAATRHLQAIYNDSECPTELHDKNGDGFVDSFEINESYQGMLIPLDGDLSAQQSGFDYFPQSNSQGLYVYYQETDLDLLLDDLLQTDTNIDDDFQKWDRSKQMLLEDKIIIIHGVADDVYLPGSVRSFGTYSDRASLPIACAKIIRGRGEEESEVEEREGRL